MARRSPAGAGGNMILGAARGAAHLQCYLDWKRTIAAKEDILSKRLLEALQIWYAKFPSSKKRGRSLLAGRPPDSIERGLLDCLLRNHSIAGQSVVP